MKAEATMFYPQADSTSQPRPTMQSTFVAYVERYIEIANPEGLKALAHKKICQVYTAVIADGEIVEVLSLEGSCIVDERYLIN